MKKSFLALTDQDKKIVLAASLAGIILLLFVAWQGLSHATARLLEQTAQERALLTWMQAADLRLQKNGRTTQTAKGTLPATLQAALTAAGLASHVTELRQNENGSVQLSLTKVDFDTLAHLLAQWQTEQGASVSQIHVTRITDAGSVNATMVLQE